MIVPVTNNVGEREQNINVFWCQIFTGLRTPYQHTVSPGKRRTYTYIIFLRTKPYIYVENTSDFKWNKIRIEI